MVGRDGSTSKENSSNGVSSDADRKAFLARRRKVDCILIGGNTARHEPYKQSPVPLVILSRSTINPVAEKRFKAQSAMAQEKLAQAEALLSKLTKAERERLAKLAAEEEDADQANSQAEARALSGVSGRAGVAIKYALKQNGDRYVFGSAGLLTWDCSGLTMRAFQAAGVSLPHSSAAQSRLGKQVSLKDLKPGDLLFYGRPVSHVGMYIGGGKMVHAPRSGSRVKITTSGSLGRKPLVGARRF